MREMIVTTGTNTQTQKNPVDDNDGVFRFLLSAEPESTPDHDLRSAPVNLLQLLRHQHGVNDVDYAIVGDDVSRGDFGVVDCNATGCCQDQV